MVKEGVVFRFQDEHVDNWEELQQSLFVLLWDWTFNEKSDQIKETLEGKYDSSREDTERKCSSVDLPRFKWAPNGWPVVTLNSRISKMYGIRTSVVVLKLSCWVQNCLIKSVITWPLRAS